MPPLDAIRRLANPHFAVRDAVQDLEATWGHPPRVRSIAERVRMEEPVVRRLLADLAAAGYVVWWPQDDVAWYCPGLPLAGEVR